MRGVLWGLMLLAAAAPAAAQGGGDTVLDSTGYATTMVHNRSTDVVDVEVELRHGTVTKERIDLGDRVDAIVSPSRFWLAPGEAQLVRLLVREELPPGTVIRLVTTLVPREAREVRRTEGGAVAHLRLATRFISVVRAP